MACSKGYETFAPSSDSTADKSNVNQSVRWQGDAFRQALDSMKSDDTGSAHLPSFTIGNDSANIFSQLDDSIKKLDQDIHTLEQDLTKMQADKIGMNSTDSPQATLPVGNNDSLGKDAPPSNVAPSINEVPPGVDAPPSNDALPSNDTPTNIDKPSSPTDTTRPPTPTGPVNAGEWTQQTINGMKYDVLLPANYDPSQKYPTVLYLHQLDMGTDEPDLLNEVNPWFNSAEYRTNNPSIVVMPLLDQSANPSGEQINFGGVSIDRQAGQDNAIAALKQVESQYSVDTSRVYVTGNSLGGIGTWDMLTKYNAVNGTNEKIFAAGMPLAGNDYAAGGSNPDPNVVEQLKSVPIWAVHGADDQQVPNTWDRSLAQSLAGDANFHYTELPTGHDVWDTIYPDQSYWTWLFNQQAP